jgi:tight adherence protein B
MRVRRARRTPTPTATGLATALEHAARDVRAGYGLRAALVARGGTLWPATALAEGEPLARAVHAWAARATSPDERLAATAVSLAVSAGGATALALDTAAFALRERASVRAEARAQATTALASAIVVGGLPVVVLVFTLLGDARTRAVLLGTAPGAVCLIVGLGLDALGLWWMKRLVRTAAIT